MDQGLRIARIFGIPVHLHPTWFAVFVLVVWGLGTYLAGAHPGMDPLWRAAVSVAVAVLLFVSVLLHELGHAVLALRHRVAVHSITLYLFGGVAWMKREAGSARGELAIAAAGPATSALLAALFFLASRGFEPGSPGLATFRWLAVANAGVAAFNLLPGFPLDGGRVLRALLWRRDGDAERATRVAARVGHGIAAGLGLLGLGVLPGQPVVGLWLLFASWLVLSASGASGRRASTELSLRGLVARDVMSPLVQTVEATTPVARFAEDCLLRGERWALVLRNGEPVGLVTRTDVRRLPPERWGDTAVGDVATPIGRVATTAPDRPLAEVLQRLTETGANQIPVVEGALVLGAVTRRGLLDALEVRSGRAAGQ